MRKIGYPLLVCAALAALGGCALRTPYVAPAVATRSQWTTTPDSAPAPTEAWWHDFGEPHLDRLVERVLARNNDLAAAALTVQAAQIKAGIAVINPTVTANATYGLDKPFYGSLPSYRSENTELTVAYELDLFGKLAAQRDVALWEAKATRQDLQAARLALIGTTVKIYYQIGYLNYRIRAAQESVAYARRTLTLVEVQRGAGAVSALELAQARNAVSTQQALLRDLVQQRLEARSSLDLLLNGEPADPDDDLQQVPADPKLPVDPGLPAELLGRRPDLMAAELRLREELAFVDQTRLSFYPALSLTGSLATGSLTQLTPILGNPVGTLAGNLALPFAQFDRIGPTIAGERLRYDQAVINFRQTFYKALTDVENALAARGSFADQAALQQAALDTARIAEHLNEVRYRQGAIALQVWLDAQEKRRQAEVTLALVQLDRIYSHVALVQALGGGARSN